MTSRENPQKPDLQREVDVRARRKLRAKKRAGNEVWFGLGMMGIIGWSVSIPTLLGAFLGYWLDQNYPGGRSWTLALLVAGLFLGCWNAWYWVAKEDRAIREEQKDDGD